MSAATTTPTDYLARRLADTAQLDAALAHATTITGRAGGTRVGSTGHREYPMPVNLAASDARLALRGSLRRACSGTLAAYADALARRDDRIPPRRLPEHLDRGPANASTTACASWLLAVLIAEPGLVEPVVAELLEAYRAADRTLTAGQGENTDETAPELDEDSRAAVAGHYVTAAEVEALTATTGDRVKASTVRVWASRGKLRGREIDGRTVYRLSEVFAVATKRAE